MDPVRQSLASAAPKMDKAVDHFREELKAIRSGRASTALVENLDIEVYGQKMPLKSIATLSTPDARTIAITPWDRSNMAPIEKTIRETQSLGLNPSNDGATIRLNIPPLTEERRKEIAKSVGEKAEQCHISIRNIRHDILSDVRKLEKEKQATQDDVKFAEAELNKKIETYRKQVEEIQKAKEAELLEV
jgi:ribosome recycling factor